jgi:hypothetical protein
MNSAAWGAAGEDIYTVSAAELGGLRLSWRPLSRGSPTCQGPSESLPGL